MLIPSNASLDLLFKMPLTEHFTWQEALWLPTWQVYHTPTPEEVYRIKQLANKLEQVRRDFGKPFNVDVWIRPTHANVPGSNHDGCNYNALIGGAPSSSHITGEAVDFKVQDTTVDEFMAWIAPRLATYQLAAEDNGSKNNRNWIHLQGRPLNGNPWRVFAP